MDPAGGARLRPRERLTSGSQYRRVFRQGSRLDGALFLLVAAPNLCGHDRIGIAVSRKVGNAPKRNRAKRLVREAFRRNKTVGERGYDLVVVAKAELAASGLAEVEHEFTRRRKRLGKPERRGPRPGSSR